MRCGGSRKLLRDLGHKNAAQSCSRPFSQPRSSMPSIREPNK